MQVLIPVGLGELYDKISILEIKQERIHDRHKLEYVSRELAELRAAASAYPIERNVYAALKEVNERLWDVEDRIRLQEARKTFEAIFIELARSVYTLNDRRAEIKKEINITHGSSIVEVKHYSKK